MSITTPPSQLLRSRRFWPLLTTIFLGAVNDNVFKNAVLLVLTYRAGALLGLQPAVSVQIATGLFVLPFLLFSALAGQLADKYEKSRLIRYIKLAEIVIAVLAAIGFAMEQYGLLLFALFLMGTHSAFFGPLKFAILPQHLEPTELLVGNAWVASGTFAAVLCGSIFAGVLVAMGASGPSLAGLACVVVAILGYAASACIPPAPAADPQLRLKLNPIAETIRNLRMARQSGDVFHLLLGIAWFWFFGSIFLSQFAPYVKYVLGGDELLATTLLTTFIVGIAAGAFLCKLLSGKSVEPGMVPLGSIGLTLFAADLWWASTGFQTGAHTLHSFLQESGSTRIIFDLVMLGASGGLYTVPLYAMVQQRTDPIKRSRLIAGGNIMNAGFMVIASILCAQALRRGVTIPEIFLAAGMLNVVAALYLYRFVPEFCGRLSRYILRRAVQ